MGYIFGRGHPLDCSRAVAAVVDEVDQQMTDAFTDWGLLEEERREAVYVALWAHQELDRTSPWRRSRRRFLDRVFEQQSAYADRLKAVLLDAERRGVHTTDGTLA